MVEIRMVFIDMVLGKFQVVPMPETYPNSLIPFLGEEKSGFFIFVKPRSFKILETQTAAQAFHCAAVPVRLGLFSYLASSSSACWM